MIRAFHASLLYLETCYAKSTLWVMVGSVILNIENSMSKDPKHFEKSYKYFNVPNVASIGKTEEN